MIIKKNKTNNPTIIEVGAEYTRKKSKNNFKEYNNIKKYYPVLDCFLDESDLIIKTIHGLNGYDYPNEELIVKELLKLHNKGICQGDLSPKDTIIDSDNKVWFIDWADANNGLQLIDVIDYVMKKNWNNESPKQFRKRLLKDSFFTTYLDFCIKELAKRKIEKLKQDYKEEQREQKFFEVLL